MNQFNVAYISSYAYAAGAANDTRTMGLVRSLRLAGLNVMQPSAKNMRPASLRQKLLARIPVARTFGMGAGIRAWLSSLNPKPDVVFVYGADPRFLRPARKWARSHKVAVVVEVVDWYDIRDGVTPGQKFFIGLTNVWSMPMEASRCDGAVVASRALENYFSDRGLICLRIPAIMDAIGPRHPESSQRSDVISIIYAGTPGRRDRKTLDNIGRLKDAASLSGLRVEVDVIGVTAPLPASPATDSSVKVRYHGRVPRETVLALTSRADFSVLQRDPTRRFARAGFPSKVAESLLLGTPVLSNLSSDLGEFLRDEGNAIVLASDSYDALVDGVWRAARWMESTEPDRQKIASQSSEWFSPTAYAEGLSELLRRVAGGRKP